MKKITPRHYHNFIHAHNQRKKSKKTQNKNYIQRNKYQNDYKCLVTSNINREDWSNIIKGKNGNLESIPIEKYIAGIINKIISDTNPSLYRKIKSTRNSKYKKNGKDYYLLFKISLKIMDSLKKYKITDSLK